MVWFKLHEGWGIHSSGNMAPLRSITLVVVCVDQCFTNNFVCCVLQKLGDVLYMWHHSNWSNALHDSNHAVLYNIIWLMNNSIFSSDSVFLLEGQHFSLKYNRDWKRDQLSSHWGCWSRGHYNSVQGHCRIFLQVANFWEPHHINPRVLKRYLWWCHSRRPTCGVPILDMHCVSFECNQCDCTNCTGWSWKYPPTYYGQLYTELLYAFIPTLFPN